MTTKDTVELRNRIKTRALCHIRNPQSQIGEQFFCILGPHAGDKFAESQAGSAFEYLAEVMVAYVDMLGDAAQSQSLIGVSVHKISRFGDAERFGISRHQEAPVGEFTKL